MYERTWEHTFGTAEAHARVRFRRALERRALWMAEDAAREMPELSLETPTPSNSSTCTLRGSSKYERAAMRWLERYLTEGKPRPRLFAEVTSDLAKPELLDD